MDRYDTAIIGTGPAGLSAAITLKLRGKNILLLGSKNLSTKIERAHLIQNYPGLPNISGEELRERFKEHIESMGISVTEDMVNTVYALGTHFAIMGHRGSYESKTVILATGMSQVKPLEGELENLGRGVSYCATCDAALYRGKSAIIAAYSEENEEEAEFLCRVADSVTYIPMYDCKLQDKDNLTIFNASELISVKKEEKGMVLSTDRGEIAADGIFILRQMVLPSQLVPGLEMKDNHVACDYDMKTNINGLFVCGDIAGTPYQYIKAAGEGNKAALSAVNYLFREERK